MVRASVQARPRRRVRRHRWGRTALARALPWTPAAVRAAALAALPFAPPLVLALLLRLAVIPPGITLDVTPLIGDEGNYLGIARSIVDGEGIPDRWAWLRPPGYPLVLAALLRLTGGSLRAPLLLQAAAGVVTVAACAALTGRLWGRRAALGAAWWAALDPSLIYYTRMLHAEVLYTTLVALLALALLRYAAPRATARPLAAGAVLAGLAALVRPTLVATLPLLAGWIVLRRWRGDRAAGLRHAALFLALWGAIIAPNTVRNWIAYERFIPLDTTLGYTFWRDHRDGSLEDLNRTLAAIRNPGDRQQYAIRQVLAWVAAHPRETVERSIINLRIQWGEPVYITEAVEKRRGVPEGWRRTVDTLTLLTWLALMPLAIVAASRAPRLDPLVPLALLAVVGPSIGVALSHPENRFLMPSRPLLIAIAMGVLAPRAAAVFSRRRRLIAAVAIGVFLLQAWTISAPLARQRGAVAAHWLAGQIAEQAGATADAARHYEAMLAWDGRLSEPHERLAALAHARGDDDAALAGVGRALERDGDNFRARALGARILLARGQEAEVRRLFARGGATVPDGLDWAWDRRADDRPPPSRLALDGADSGLVRGFYGPERGDGGRPFRWMGGRGEVRLAAPPPGRPAVLSLTLAAPPPPDAPPVEVLVAVNGREVGRAIVRRDRGWNDIRLALPADLDPARPLTVELRAPIVRLDPDRRALGVAVASVAVEPAP